MHLSVEIPDESFSWVLNDEDLAQLAHVISNRLGVAFTAVKIVIVEDPEPGTTDDKLRPGQTVKEALDRCMEIVGERRSDLVRSQGEIKSYGDSERAHGNIAAPAREFSLAITAMEDAQMRYARGRHMQEGTFSPSDVDRWLADGADPAEVVAERDRIAGKKD